MLRYLIKRLLTGLVLLFIYVTILFFTVQAILPGDFVSQYTLGLTPGEAAALRQKLGLDTPAWQRYLYWLSHVLRGDLGTSFSILGEGPPVTQIIAQSLPVTMLIFGLGTVVAFLLGQWLGRVAAWRGPGLMSGSITFISIALYTSFPPWLAFLMYEFVALRFGIPVSLEGRPRFDAPGVDQAHVITLILVGLALAFLATLLFNWLAYRIRRRPLPQLLFFLLLMIFWAGSWFLFGVREHVPGILRQMAIPTVTYVLLSFGEMMLIMRTSMMDTLHEDYVQTAHAKGLAEHRVRDQHAARNALLPVASRMMISLPFLLSGMVMIEEVMNVQGIGSALFYAVGQQNIPLALGATIVIGMIALLARLLLEVMLVALDPRLRIASSS
ncbi:MAG: ABC transporter permease [Anaerolineales bacterium]|nr:ABC transporter permease [Anaerolineales bacterium]